MNENCKCFLIGWYLFLGIWVVDKVVVGNFYILYFVKKKLILV